MSPRTKGVLAGGIVSGVLAIIPIVNLGNCCLCLWVYLCALMAAAVHVKSSGEPVTSGTGTVTGLMVIIPTVVIYLLVGLPIALVLGPILLGVIASMSSDPALQEQIAQQMGAGMVQRVLQHVVQTFALGVVGGGMAALGGLTGVALFEDRPPPTPSGPLYQAPPRAPGQPYR
jgi:cellobiose-specific phosphotransferase system component IIC